MALHVPYRKKKAAVADQSLLEPEPANNPLDNNKNKDPKSVTMFIAAAGHCWVTCALLPSLTLLSDGQGGREVSVSVILCLLYSVSTANDGGKTTSQYFPKHLKKVSGR